MIPTSDIERPFESDAAKFLAWRRAGVVIKKSRAIFACMEVVEQPDTIQIEATTPHSSYRLETLTCQRCGNSFEKLVYKGRRPLFCSTLCQKRSTREGKAPARPCAACGQEFFPKLVGDGHRFSVTCSRTCAGTWSNRFHASGRKQLPADAPTAATFVSDRPCVRCQGLLRYKSALQRCVACTREYTRAYYAARCEEVMPDAPRPETQRWSAAAMPAPSRQSRRSTPGSTRTRRSGRADFPLAGDHARHYQIRR
jgi:hypothetical protein